MYTLKRLMSLGGVELTTPFRGGGRGLEKIETPPYLMTWPMCGARRGIRHIREMVYVWFPA
jgi:hypothetical protein